MDQQTLDTIKNHVLDESKDRWRFDNVATLYMLRPNLKYQRLMKNIMRKMVPEEFNAETALGLPIRSKCNSVKRIIFQKLFIVKKNLILFRMFEL